jgi:hypothetical protein
MAMILVKLPEYTWNGGFLGIQNRSYFTENQCFWAPQWLEKQPTYNVGPPVMLVDL